MELDLRPYRVNKTSQNGEDGVIEKLFELAKIKKGFLVEFGAWDGVYLSNTFYHYNQGQNGFKTCQIEPDKDRFDQMTKNIRWDDNAILLNHPVDILGENSLNSIFTKYNINDIALLSIDVDGDDLEIWNALDTNRFRPNIVIIEEGKWQNAVALGYLSLCFHRKGYDLVCVTGNFIFMDRKFGIKAKDDIHDAMAKCGSPEYKLWKELITEDEFYKQVYRQQSGEADVFTKLSDDQIITYEV